MTTHAATGNSSNHHQHATQHQQQHGTHPWQQIESSQVSYETRASDFLYSMLPSSSSYVGNNTSSTHNPQNMFNNHTGIDEQPSDNTNYSHTRSYTGPIPMSFLTGMSTIADQPFLGGGLVDITHTRTSQPPDLFDSGQ